MFVIKNEQISLKTRQIALTGILTALALSLSFLESLLPTFAFMPPGAKLGLANILVMVSLNFLGLPYAFGISLAKSAFAGFMRGPSSMFISFLGGLFSLFILYVFKRFLRGRMGILGISISSALMHNIGQLVGASILVGANLFLAYAPFLFLMAIVTGAVTGTAYFVIAPYAESYFKSNK